MRFDVVTLFPEMFRAMIGEGVTGRAVHRTVDDRPYGGGPGMVMKIEPLRDAITRAKQAAPDSAVVYLSPQGRRFDQAAAVRMARQDGVILVAGRSEGIDERLISRYVDEEWSIGDYVLSGGELPALVLMDAVIRLIPGVLGDKDSAEQDSFVDGLLDCPHYTRPEVFEGDRVPSVLLGGNHELIRRWRLQQSLGRTWQRRPDLLEGRVLSQEEENLLNEFIQAHTSAD